MSEIFASSIRRGQHLYCLVAKGLTLHDAMLRCLDNGISVLGYEQQEDRWVFKVIAPVNGVEVVDE